AMLAKKCSMLCSSTAAVTNPINSPLGPTTLRAIWTTQVLVARLRIGPLTKELNCGLDLSAMKKSRSATLIGGIGQDREKLNSLPSALNSEKVPTWGKPTILSLSVKWTSCPDNFRSKSSLDEIP